MHTAIRKLQKATTPERLANRVSCAVKLDFSKAFDRFHRSFPIKLFKELNFHDFSVRAIEILYLDSKAVIETNRFFYQPGSKFIRETRLPCFCIFIHDFYRVLTSSN